MAVNIVFCFLNNSLLSFLYAKWCDSQFRRCLIQFKDSANIHEVYWPDYQYRETFLPKPIMVQGSTRGYLCTSLDISIIWISSLNSLYYLLEFMYCTNLNCILKIIFGKETNHLVVLEPQGPFGNMPSGCSQVLMGRECEKHVQQYFLAVSNSLERL